MSRKLLQLLKKWLSSAGLSWVKLCGLQKQHRITYRKMRLRSCAHGYPSRARPGDGGEVLTIGAATRRAAV